MDMWLGGLFCLFLGMGLMMAASEALPPLHIDNKWQGAGLGCGITALLQSSSAVSCSVCAMVQNGTLPLHAAYAVLIGSNVGTCVTPFLTALGLRVGGLSYLFALIGILALLLKDKFPRLSLPVAGFCLLMWGMHIMTAESALFEAVASHVTWLSTPLGAWAVGLLSTALLQSSSLTMGLLQVYALTTPLTMNIALPFILGQNIGTTATALLATISATPVARKCALYHVKFNVIGTLWALPLSLLCGEWLSFAATPMALALAQLLFNVICALLHLFTERLQ
ncbi:MAG: Na/Pi cotransporter family protein [Clostridia bacterium]|nr:Na/Pi cotransporter family protein [Clostridia bacterium]